MPQVFIDQSQVTFEHVSTTDTDGSEVDTLAFIVPVVIPLDQVPAWEAAYDPSSSSSPLAGRLSRHRSRSTRRHEGRSRRRMKWTIVRY